MKRINPFGHAPALAAALSSELHPTRRRLILWSLISILSFGFATQVLAVTKTAQPMGGSLQLFPAGDFESPAVTTPNGFVYRPSGSLWTFVGGSGYSKNATPFTNGNPPAPDGQQVLFLQGTGRVNQNLDFVAGFYSFELQAAQRGNFQASSQTFELRVDGQAIASFTPAGTNYELLSTGPFFIASGQHTVELRGLNPNGGDNTAFVDLLQYKRHIGILVNGGGMEDPVITTSSGYQYRPTGGPWSFYGGSGLTKNKTAFTNANPSAPEGQQVMFLQGTGNARISIPVQQAGHYRVRFKAALRANNNPATEHQVVEVLVDGHVLGSFDIPDFNYTDLYTMPLHLATGAHVLHLRGLNPQAGDNTAFIDMVELERIHDWQDGQVWGGTAPTAADDVVIPAGVSVALSGNTQAHNVTIHGELVASVNQTFDFNSKNIMLMGAGALLEVGREGAPYLQAGSFTMNATATDPEIMFMGNKFIAAMNGATLNLHGEEKVNWTQLDGTANPGAFSIVLAEPVDWEVGDSIVIAPTDFDPHQAEARRITSVSPNGKTIGLSGGLQYKHYGAIETYSNGTRSWDLDMRAEVGLLTRNIKVKGDAASTTDGFGAHVMVMPTAFGYVDGVEFFLCGQKGILARYPFHWHRAQDVSGQYMKNSSVHRSYNRVVTVHSSQNALVEGVVGYDHIGHGFFLETADETGCVFKDNLGVLTRMPKPTEKVEPHDLEIEGAFVKLPSTFWIANPGNDYMGNASAGSEGSGFWMVSVSQSIEGNPAQAPYKTPMGVFDDNRAHSNSFSNFAIDGGLYKNPQNDSIYFVNGHYRPEIAPGVQSIPQINRFTGFRCKSRNVWMRANTMEFDECALSDSRLLTLFAFNQILKNSLLVGRSANTGSNINTVVGYNVYDGPAEFENCHFAGFSGNAWCFRPVGAAQKSTVHQITGLTFDPAIPATNKVKFDHLSHYDHMLTTGLWDNDGSLTGTAGTHLAAEIKPYSGAPVYRLFESGFNHAPTDTYNSDFRAYLGTGHHYGLMRFDYLSSVQTAPPIYSIRSDGPAVYTYSPKLNKFQTPVIVNESYDYRYQFHQLPKRLENTLRFTQPGDEMVSVLTNIPSTATVVTSTNAAIPPAASLAALRAQSSAGWFFEGNTVYMKHYSGYASTTTQWQFGDDFPGYSYLRVCVDGCGDPTGIIDHMTLADCEFPSDPRMLVNGTVGSGGAIFDPAASPGDAVDNKVSFTIQSDGDGVNEYRQLKIAFPRQVWNEFKTLQLNFTGPNLQVYVHDASDGYTNLGSFAQGSAVNIPLTLAQDPTQYHRFDEVDWILLRVFENSIGGVNAVTSGTVNLYGAFLYDHVPSPKTATAGEGRMEDQMREGVSVSPNPSNGAVSLKAYLAHQAEVNISVRDIHGKLWYAEQVEAEGEWKHGVDLKAKGLAAGVYLMEFRFGTERVVQHRLVLTE